jgi:hypothetical protein
MNVSEHYQFYSVKVQGLPGIQLVGESVIELPAESARIFTFEVRLDPEQGKPGANAIYFDIESLLGDSTAHEKATFLIPR